MKTSIVASALAWTLIVTSLAHAATINWGSATNIAGDSDVAVNGNLVGAVNVGGSAVLNTTVNGVNFLPFSISGTSSTTGIFTMASPAAMGSNDSGGTVSPPFSSLSTDYQKMLQSFAGNTSVPFKLTMSSLTIGNKYEFQVWVNTSATSEVLVTATAGNAVTLDSNPGNTTGNVGQFAIGTFVADSTSQTVTFSGPGTNVVIDGAQLRDISFVPLPSSLWGGLALGGCLVAVRITRRRSSHAL